MMDLDARIQDIACYEPCCEGLEQDQQIKSLIQDVIKEVTPERMGEGLQPQYSQGMNRAIDHIEAKAKKLLGGEE